jgi:FkbH-like protein
MYYFNNITHTQILKENNQVVQENLKPLHISVLRNIMVEPQGVFTKFLLNKIGFTPVFSYGNYDNIIQDIYAGGDLVNEKTDVVSVYLNLNNFSALKSMVVSGNQSVIDEETERIRSFITQTLEGIRQRTGAIILWHGFELPLYAAMGIAEYTSAIEQQQLSIINRLNEFAIQMLTKSGNAYYIDMNAALVRTGAQQFYDKRYWYIGKSPYSNEAYRAIAGEEFKVIKALKGFTKKCLVLDCDNTLWGGIIGEDGLQGIKLSKSHPGNAFQDFQREILNLYHKGVIIALCSKNNEEDVWRVFDEHPDILLKRNHIAAYRINWNNKATNIREIAEELNIGIDSLVFVDDNDFEINLVQEMIPEVTCIKVNPEKSYEYPELLASSGLFDTITISEEDRKRGEMYRAESERKKQVTSFTDLTEYYKSLEMEIDIYEADEANVGRIAQLTQKTNQFNLTTRRYTEEDIRKMLNSPDYAVFYLKLKDKFGDLGITGISILHNKNHTSEIDSFLLSCRVIGREVENIFLNECIQHAHTKGATQVEASYIQTRKNGQTSEFYDKNGFKVVSQEASEKRYAKEIENNSLSSYQLFKSINTHTK